MFSLQAALLTTQFKIFQGTNDHRSKYNLDLTARRNAKNANYLLVLLAVADAMATVMAIEIEFKMEKKGIKLRQSSV